MFGFVCACMYTCMYSMYTTLAHVVCVCVCVCVCVSLSLSLVCATVDYLLMKWCADLFIYCCVVFFAQVTCARPLTFANGMAPHVRAGSATPCRRESAGV